MLRKEDRSGMDVEKAQVETSTQLDLDPRETTPIAKGTRRMAKQLKRLPWIAISPTKRSNDVTEGVLDEEGSGDDDSVKTDRGDNVMSSYSGDEKVSEDTGDQESASEETGDEEKPCDTQVNQLKQSKSKKGKEAIGTSDGSEGNNSRSPKQKKKKDNLYSVAPKDILEQAVHNKMRKPTADGDQANKKAKEATKPMGGKEKVSIAKPNKKVQKGLNTNKAEVVPPTIQPEDKVKLAEKTDKKKTAKKASTRKSSRITAR
ncbi:hypothetical protein LWI28_013178 [Acer negundo]|uniref:Uncharacterized protein n=1 Tax=Acer negundo TaxID=4023 RepID=A0AAD5ILK8_ACENE|nr:hypothetical protein LWI28_013178 [Acer negundo]